MRKAKPREKSRVDGAVQRAMQLVGRLFGLAPRNRPALLLPEDVAVFPGPVRFDEHGLVAVGGDLAPARLLAAYRAGIFPWYGDDTPILWWSPDPRAVIELDGLHVSRRLARTVRSGRFKVTFDHAFAEVMAGCGDREEGTWITPEMHEAYGRLHALGHAHSVEVWHRGELAGGVYGVTIGGMFAGESMFSRVPDASKVALVHLLARLRERGFTLFDIQYLTPHTARLGGVEMPRAEYLRRLKKTLSLSVKFC
jgi:leucyl/phenylalanyl-tRNA--protein transferase